jgi:hypothetical protein
MLSALLRFLVIRRLFGGGSRRRGRGYGYGYGPSLGYRRAGRRRSGFGMTGPFPTYSTRTRGGSRVSVGGCCLPIPLALALGTAGLGRVLTRR